MTKDSYQKTTGNITLDAEGLRAFTLRNKTRMSTLITLIVVLIYVSLMNNDIEYLFMC